MEMTRSVVEAVVFAGCPQAADDCWAMLPLSRRDEFGMFDAPTVGILAERLAALPDACRLGMIAATSDPEVLECGVAELSPLIVDELLAKERLLPQTLQRIAAWPSLSWSQLMDVAFHPSCPRPLAQQLVRRADAEGPANVVSELRVAQLSGAELVEFAQQGREEMELAFDVALPHSPSGSVELVEWAVRHRQGALDAARLARALSKIRPLRADLLAVTGLSALGGGLYVEFPPTAEELLPLLPLVTDSEAAATFTSLLHIADQPRLLGLAVPFARQLAAEMLWDARGAWEICARLAAGDIAAVVAEAAKDMNSFAVVLRYPEARSFLPPLPQLLSMIESASGRGSSMLGPVLSHVGAAAGDVQVFVDWLVRTQLDPCQVAEAVRARVERYGTEDVLLSPALLEPFGGTDLQRQLIDRMRKPLSDRDVEQVADLPGLLRDQPGRAGAAAARFAARQLSAGQLVVFAQLAERFEGSLRELVELAKRM